MRARPWRQPGANAPQRFRRFNRAANRQRLLIVSQQRFNFQAQLGIRGAQAVEVHAALRRLQHTGLAIRALDLLISFRRHRYHLPPECVLRVVRTC